MDPKPPLTILYDARCAFCRWVVARLRHWDRKRSLRIRPYQDTREQPMLADLLRGRALGQSLHVVDAAGRVAAGGDAILAIAALLPGGRGVTRLVHGVPLSRAALGLAYRVVAWMRPALSRLGFDGRRIRERSPALDGVPPGRPPG